MKKKYRNIEYCKGLALLLVLIYHYWVLSGSISIKIPGISTLVMLGGEIGVTMFFVLSGFGIYCLLEKQCAWNWITFIKTRFLKIAPPYYISIILIICLTAEGATFLSEDGIDDIITHLLFIHNLKPDCHGSINGSLWTMGVIFQFYLVAVFLFRCMKKNSRITVGLSILCSILIKVIVYQYVLNVYGSEQIDRYFFVGRQIFTVIDNFVLGMFSASIIQKKEKRISEYKGIVYLLPIIIVLIFWGELGVHYGVYRANLLGYVWHSVLAVLICAFVFILGMMKEKDRKGVIERIGENEYGIYLLHFPVLQNMMQAMIFENLNAKEHYLIGCILFLLMAFGVGIPLNKISGIAGERNSNKNKEKLLNQ